MTKLKRYIYGAAGTLAAFSMVMSPALVSAADTSTDTAGTTVQATVGPTISVSNSTDPVALVLNPTATAVESIGSDVVTVNSNDTTGYHLTIGASDGTNVLSGSGNTISATTGETALGGTATALDTNSWGWCITGDSSCDGSYTTGNNQSAGASFIAMPVSGSDIEVKRTSSAATNDTTTFYYGVMVDNTQATDVYTDNVTYTATTNA